MPRKFEEKNHFCGIIPYLYLNSRITLVMGRCRIGGVEGIADIEKRRYEGAQKCGRIATHYTSSA